MASVRLDLKSESREPLSAPSLLPLLLLLLLLVVVVVVDVMALAEKLAPISTGSSLSVTAVTTDNK